MTYEILWADEPFAAAQVFMADDLAGLAAVLDAGPEPLKPGRPPRRFRAGDQAGTVSPCSQACQAGSSRRA